MTESRSSKTMPADVPQRFESHASDPLLKLPQELGLK